MLIHLLSITKCIRLFEFFWVPEILWKLCWEGSKRILNYTKWYCATCPSFQSRDPKFGMQILSNQGIEIDNRYIHIHERKIWKENTYRDEVCPGLHIFQIGSHMFPAHTRIIADHGNASDLCFRFTSQKQGNNIKGFKALFERPLVSIPHLEGNNTTSILVSMWQDYHVLGSVPDHRSHMFG